MKKTKKEKTLFLLKWMRKSLDMMGGGNTLLARDIEKFIIDVESEIRSEVYISGKES